VNLAGEPSLAAHGSLEDHLPLHRQEKIFERHGVDISRKTMCGWLAQCADLLKPLYGSLKEVLFQSKVIGTGGTRVKVLNVKLPFARTGRIWPYYGDQEHPVILDDYTATRERAGPEEFLKGYRGYLQADAYGGYDAFFKDAARGLIEVGCWAHARRYFHKALESDQPPYGAGAIAHRPAISGGKASAAADGGKSAWAAPTPIAAHPGQVA
jgi:transposase